VPDLKGRLLLPSNLNINLTSFKIRDGEGAIAEIVEGTVAEIRMDGEGAVGHFDREIPTIVGKAIVLPQMKVREYRVDFNQTQIGTSEVGGIPLNIAEGDSVDLTSLQFSSQKLTQYTLNLSIAIQENASNLPATTAEYVVFKPYLDLENATGIIYDEFPNLIWSPDYGFGHKRYSMTTSIRTEALQGVGASTILRLQKKASSNLQGSRDIRCEFQAFLVSV
jgi:hypothetical protein